MPATPVLMVFHNHQPVGNLPWIVEDCFHTAYLPFLEALERHPAIRVGLHFTGPLFEWLQIERPDYLAHVRAMVEAGRVEVLGGGFYEPILPVIPERDRNGQLRLMRESVMAAFGCEPQGAWLAERVWEPGLPSTLHAAGAQYVLVDDEALLLAGFTEQQTRATFLTEDNGAAVRVLPINRRLRYTLPTRPVAEVMQTLHAMIDEGAEALIYAEDGERYGNWPGTFDYLYGDEAYLDELFDALEADDDLRLTLPGEYVRTVPPRALVYLPPSSYSEMLEWSGGNWRNFLTRYAESNLMHKKMYQVSRWVAQAEQAGFDVRHAQRELYAGQCNCAYWHGVFGGIYFPHLRRAVYRHLLQAERQVAPFLIPEQRPACEIGDFDCDGREEIWLRTDNLSVGIAPARGGAVFALEHAAGAVNLLATMRRYPPAQHVVDAPVDWYPRHAFLDHLLPADAEPGTFRDADYGELGDFVLGEYEVCDARAGAVHLRREGHCWDGADFVSLVVEKGYTVIADELTVAYRLTNPTAKTRHLRFAVEINMALSAGDGPDRRLEIHTPDTREWSLLETGCCPHATGVTYCDDWLPVAVCCDWQTPAMVWVAPIHTPLASIAGCEQVYQSTVALPIWEVSLAPGQSWEVAIRTRVAASTLVAI